MSIIGYFSHKDKYIIVNIINYNVKISIAEIMIKYNCLFG